MNKRMAEESAQFDFQVGHIVKSPCRDCTHNKLPKCIKGCRLLQALQAMISRGVSSGKSHSAREAYSLSLADIKHN